MINLSLGKSLEENGKEIWNGDMRSGGWDIICLKFFRLICATLEIRKEDT